MLVGECIGRTSKAWVFYFGLDWGWQRMFQAEMNPVQNLYPEHGGQGFQNGGQDRGDGEFHLCRVPLPLTLSTLTGQRINLRKLYPITGIMQRTVLSTRHSHICGWLRMFLATPTNSEPGKERVKIELGVGRNQPGHSSILQAQEGRY